jgi:hypothetical protein
MKDMRAQLEKLRAQAAECELICSLATNPEKRELFTRLAAHFKVSRERGRKNHGDLAAGHPRRRESLRSLSEERVEPTLRRRPFN